MFYRPSIMEPADQTKPLDDAEPTIRIPTPPPPPILSNFDIKVESLSENIKLESGIDGETENNSAGEIVESSGLSNGTDENHENTNSAKKKEKFRKMLEKKKLRKRTHSSSNETPVPKNAVMALNEYKKKLEYIVETTEGPPHACDYTLSIVVDDNKFTATASQKKLAKHKVAELALEYLKEKGLYTGEYLKMSELLGTKSPGKDTIDYEVPVKKKKENGVHSSDNALAVINRMYPGLKWDFSEQTGPVHCPTFTVNLMLDGKTFTGSGSSKQKAKQNVAEKALAVLPSKPFKPHMHSKVQSPLHKMGPMRHHHPIRQAYQQQQHHHHQPMRLPPMHGSPPQHHHQQFNMSPRMGQSGSPRMMYNSPRMSQPGMSRMPQSFSPRMSQSGSPHMSQSGSPHLPQLGHRISQLGSPRMQQSGLSPKGGMPCLPLPPGPMRNMRLSGPSPSMMGPRGFGSGQRFGPGLNDNRGPPQTYDMISSYQTPSFTGMSYQRSSMPTYQHDM